MVCFNRFLSLSACDFCISGPTRTRYTNPLPALLASTKLLNFFCRSLLRNASALLRLLKLPTCTTQALGDFVTGFVAVLVVGGIPDLARGGLPTNFVLDDNGADFSSTGIFLTGLTITGTETGACLRVSRVVIYGGFSGILLPNTGMPSSSGRSLFSNMGIKMTASEIRTIAPTIRCLRGLYADTGFFNHPIPLKRYYTLSDLFSAITSDTV